MVSVFVWAYKPWIHVINVCLNSHLGVHAVGVERVKQSLYRLIWIHSIHHFRNFQKTHSLVPKITKHYLQDVAGNKYMKWDFKHAFTLHWQRTVFVILPLHTNLMRVDLIVCTQPPSSLKRLLIRLDVTGGGNNDVFFFSPVSPNQIND